MLCTREAAARNEEKQTALHWASLSFMTGNLLWVGWEVGSVGESHTWVKLASQQVALVKNWNGCLFSSRLEVEFLLQCDCNLVGAAILIRWSMKKSSSFMAAQT
jgi:hypothetical protein